MPFEREAMQAAATRLAARGVFLGTSSWKYPGWRGQLYDEARYVWRGRFAETRFDRLCLSEYATVFKTVCVDAAYYRFPEARQLDALAAQVPADFRFGFKVTDEITLRRFPQLPRFGARAGRANENFLNAGLFASSFLGPCETIRSHVGILIFEFARLYPSDYAHGRDFVADLDRFLGQLPAGWPYGVEIRNRHFLQPEYFATLRRHQVAHVFNSWTDMPPMGEQRALPGSLTHPGLCAARLLLRPGRDYEEAVRRFQPYDRLQDPDPATRDAGAALIREGLAAGPARRTYVFVNNRLEGNALETLQALVDALG